MSDRDWLYEAQLAAENQLVAVSDAEDAAEGALSQDIPPENWPPSPAVAPWDGCNTCVVREVLAAAHPYLIAEVAQWLVGQDEPELAAHLQREFKMDWWPAELPDQKELLAVRHG